MLLGEYRVSGMDYNLGATTWSSRAGGRDRTSISPDPPPGNPILQPKPSASRKS